MDEKDQLLTLHCIKLRYLGDGVYAGFDGHQIWLVVRRDDDFHEIALEPNTALQLRRYMDQTFNKAA